MRTLMRRWWRQCNGPQNRNQPHSQRIDIVDARESFSRIWIFIKSFFYWHFGADVKAHFIHALNICCIYFSLSFSRSSEMKRNSHTRIMNIYSNEQSSLYGEEYTSICKISMSFYPHSISIFNFRSNASKSLILSLKIIKFSYTECRFFDNA